MLTGIGAPTAHDLCEYLKVVLHDAGIPFIVAPFSAAAQVVLPIRGVNSSLRPFLACLYGRA